MSRKQTIAFILFYFLYAALMLSAYILNGYKPLPDIIEQRKQTNDHR